MPTREGHLVGRRRWASSKHIKVLEHAGLIAHGRPAQFRPCTIDAAHPPGWEMCIADPAFSGRGHRGEHGTLWDDPHDY